MPNLVGYDVALAKAEHAASSLNKWGKGVPKSKQEANKRVLIFEYLDMYYPETGYAEYYINSYVLGKLSSG